MLKCRDIARLASDYTDDHLSSRQRFAFAFHLLICGKCRSFIRQLKLVLAYYRSLPSEELGDGETEAIIASVTGRDPG